MKNKIMNHLNQIIFDMSEVEMSEELTAEGVAEAFQLKRNTASHYLNELVAEEKCLKIKSRPAYFFPISSFKQKFFQPQANVYKTFEELCMEDAGITEDSFGTLIGHDGSLKQVIDQIKTSIFYPDNGLPMMFAGETGVGKSHLARVTFDYCQQHHLIKKEAKMVELNCAQYFHNPELLSSNLFGHVKGAFTGASEDRKGLLEEADGGFLFLDECHRLDPENQEKLFTFMDTGMYRKIGDSTETYHSNVRIIFATTENVQTNFLRTFLRRIPIILEIPPLAKRNSEEILSYIYLFLIREAKKINRKLKISQWVLRRLALLDYPDNVGQLKNYITLICANAFGKQNDAPTIELDVRDIPESIVGEFFAVEEIELPNLEPITITSQDTVKHFVYKSSSGNNVYQNIMKVLTMLYKNYQQDKISEKYFLHQSMLEVSSMVELLVHQDESLIYNHSFKFIQKILHEVSLFLESNFFVRIKGNSLVALAHYLYQKNNYRVVVNEEQEELQHQLKEYLHKQFPNEAKIFDSLFELLEVKMDITFDLNDQIVLLYYLKNLDLVNSNKSVRGIVLAHGFSTASSIADVVNGFLKEKIFDSFDMPLDVQLDRVVDFMESYIEEYDCSKGIVVLVDMGSLMIIYDKLKDKLEGPMLLVNNVSTQSTLFAGEMIQKGLTVESIKKELGKRDQITYELGYPLIKKKHLIITVCATGIGSARQIQDFLASSIPDTLNYQVEAVDYNFLLKHQENNPLFDQYDVTGIVGTIDPKLASVPFMSLDELVTSQGTEKIWQFFPTIKKEKDIQSINNNIVRNISIERLISAITILDVEKIIKYIDEMINIIELQSGYTLSNDKKSTLYIHVSCLVERLIRKEPDLKYLVEKETAEKVQHIQIIKNSLSEIESDYNVSIGEGELNYLHDIIFYY